MNSIEKDSYHVYDLREPVKNVVFPDRPPTDKTSISPNEWKNIPPNNSPFFKSNNERKSNFQMQPPRPPTPSQIYSPHYAAQNNVKPRATASAAIRLGGVYR
jgi:hypothetical protein